MRRYRRYGYGPRPYNPWRSFRGAFWLIGLAVLFFWGHWWPGILILIGLSIIFEGLFRAAGPQWQQNPPPPADPMPMSPMATTPIPAAPAADPVHRVDLLPGTCPHCGAPIRSPEVKWTGNQSASCGYCGANLPMKKS